jgi:hypothetical protein
METDWLIDWLTVWLNHKITYWLTGWLTHSHTQTQCMTDWLIISVKQSTCWEANIYSVIQENSRHFIQSDGSLPCSPNSTDAYSVTTVATNGTIIWEMTPCSRVERTAPIFNVKTQAYLAANSDYLAYTLTLKMEAVCSSETWVNCYHTTRSLVPDDGTAQTNRAHTHPDTHRPSKYFVFFRVSCTCVIHTSHPIP